MTDVEFQSSAAADLPENPKHNAFLRIISRNGIFYTFLTIFFKKPVFLMVKYTTFMSKIYTSCELTVAFFSDIITLWGCNLSVGVSNLFKQVN